jgi:phospholipid/cholesterol/gamma-HCH transport system substrate-binding protein
MENKSHAFAAGLFTILLTCAIVATILWFRRDTTVRVPYDVVTQGSVTGLSANAPVRYRGLPVGRVAKLGFDPDHPENILIRIVVDQSTPITQSTEASLGLQGVTGGAFLQLSEHGTDKTPLATSDDHVARIQMRPGLIEQFQQRGDALLSQIQALTSSLQNFAGDDTRRQLMATLGSLQHAADGIDTLAKQAGPVVSQIPGTLQQLDRTLASTNQLVANLNRPDGPMTTNLNRIGEAAERMSTTLNEMSARVSYDTLPRVNALAEDVRTATRSLTRAADTVSDHPRSLLFGAPAAEPGPGEPGFAWPARAAGR